MVFFRTSLKLAAPLFILALVFGGLGLWQLERKAEKENLFQRFEEAPELTLEQAMAQQEIFAQVEASGRYDPERHILLDNKILDGRAGVYVLTPFTLPDNSVLLVNRGWLPLPPDRRHLPLVPTDASTRTIRGQLNRLPEPGRRLGDADILLADQWPQLVTYLDPLPVSKALNTPLAPWLVQLDASDPTGFGGRQWKAATMNPDVHGAYAFQWFSLAATAIAIWIVLGVRQGRHLRNSSASGQSKGRDAR